MGAGDGMDGMDGMHAASCRDRRRSVSRRRPGSKEPLATTTAPAPVAAVRSLPEPRAGGWVGPSR